jgi:hypothetical protein
MLAGIAYKIASTFVFACMMAIMKGMSHYPVGEMVAFRSFFALIVLVVWLMQRGEFPAALRTRRVGGHLLRSLAGTGSMRKRFRGSSREKGGWWYEGSSGRCHRSRRLRTGGRNGGR